MASSGCGTARPRAVSWRTSTHAATCAAVAVGRTLGLLGSEVQVELPGGTLDIRWEGSGQPLWMSGPAEVVFEGHVDI